MYLIKCFVSESRLNCVSVHLLLMDALSSQVDIDICGLVLRLKCLSLRYFLFFFPYCSVSEELVL